MEVVDVVWSRADGIASLGLCEEGPDVLFVDDGASVPTGPIDPQRGDARRVPLDQVPDLKSGPVEPDAHPSSAGEEFEHHRGATVGEEEGRWDGRGNSGEWRSFCVEIGHIEQLEARFGRVEDHARLGQRPQGRRIRDFPVWDQSPEGAEPYEPRATMELHCFCSRGRVQPRRRRCHCGGAIYPDKGLL